MQGDRAFLEQRSEVDVFVVVALCVPVARVVAVQVVVDVARQTEPAVPVAVDLAVAVLFKVQLPVQTLLQREVAVASAGAAAELASTLAVMMALVAMIVAVNVVVTVVDIVGPSCLHHVAMLVHILSTKEPPVNAIDIIIVIINTVALLAVGQHRARAGKHTARDRRTHTA